MSTHKSTEMQQPAPVKIAFWKRLLVYLFASLLPPFMVGSVAAVMTLGGIMIHKTPDPLPESAMSIGETAAPALDPKKLTAVIVLSNSGTELTDLLGPYEALSASGAFNVVTAAPTKQLAPTTGAVAVYPDFALNEAPKADLLVIPATMDPQNTALSDWVRSQAEGAKIVLSLCEGARIAAAAGLLEDRRATTHFVALPDLREKSPSTRFIEGVRYVEDGELITSAGITASIDATFYAIEKLKGRALAEKTAKELGYTWNREEDPTHEMARSSSDAKTVQAPRELVTRDYLRLALRAGYDWHKTSVGVLLYPGASELGLAAALESFPRALTTWSFSTSPTRKLVRTRHGLRLVPSLMHAEAGSPDLVLVPSGLQPNGAPPSADPLQEENTRVWITAQNVQVKSFLYDLPGRAFDQTLDLLAQVEDEPVTHLVAKLMEYPWREDVGRVTSAAESSGSRDHLPIPWAKLLSLSALGVAIAAYFERKLQRASQQ